MKEIWLWADGDNWEKVKEMLKDAIELGFDGAIVRNEFTDKAKKLGKIKILNSDELIEIRSVEDQERALKKDVAIIKFLDWKVIPLENIVAMKKGKAIVIVENLEDAKLALTTLEKGADGIAVSGTRNDLKKYFEIVKGTEKTLNLSKAKIVEIKPLGLGERVCIDTVSIMNPGEGMLVGNKASFMFLVASESEESEYVASRPFRVNAGSVNAYLKVGDKTRYLCELKAGDEVEIVRFDGKVRKSYVGRVKIERRPLLLVVAEVNGETGSIILQNAETIKLVNPEGKHLSVSELKEGDEVLAWIGEKARHFGVKVEEFIIER
ncbi:MAG: 3-dehydroquinate synthase II [Archaeoglobi archaeon]|jgi:3-dehydroquinate synthase II|nr:3-dehydroquinate synthase II [Archaeoglobus sp.]NHW88687.1 3-dehydroquinate synthase II [Archaeoglobales archaeon]TDA26967.1 MAG: 3-dehydroquinate synthase II [Archaeoglobi archaeon]TDA28515.1 MAG: 3-dehydroquinate synthase II [Archaeoglobi archaeon]